MTTNERRLELAQELEGRSFSSNLERLLAFESLCRERGLASGASRAQSDESDYGGSSSPCSISSDESEDESDDGPSVITGDELWLRPVKPDPSKRIYSRDFLFSCIPEKPEFDSLRENLRIQKTEYRWDPEVSNKTYKSLYYREHKRSPPNLTKVHKVVLRGKDLDVYYGKRRPFYVPGVPFGGKEPKPVLFSVREGRVRKNPLKWVGEPPVFTSSFFARNITRRFYERRPLKRVNLVSYDTKTRKYLVNELGGKTEEYSRLPPAAHHKKYWYFLRKRGRWVPSEHHPYGDEEDLYPHSE